MLLHIYLSCLLLFLSGYRKAFEIWEDNPNIYILGGTKAKRLPIFSFVTIHHPTGKLIHHNFISTLLNAVFGIQSRGGCACAGPYAHVSTYVIYCLLHLINVRENEGVIKHWQSGDTGNTGHIRNRMKTNKNNQKPKIQHREKPNTYIW